MTAAAKALGINRQYLYELLPRYATDRADPPDHSDTTDSVGSVGRTDTVGPRGASRSVGPTQGEPLTYGRHAPTLGRMGTAALAHHEQRHETDEPEIVRVAFDLPRRLVDWLELEALRRKQASRGRMAKSPIVAELIERAMATPKSEKLSRKDSNGGGEKQRPGK